MGGLGLRDVKSFNDALLAKQAWQLEKEPNSLVSTFFRTTYGASPLTWLSQSRRSSRRHSYAWRSITRGAAILERGSAWRVSSGLRVRTSEDKWTPKPLTFKPLVDPSSKPLWVAELIDPQSRNWKIMDIHRKFEEASANAILSTYLPSSPGDDVLYWRFSANGLYTVKSSYAMLCSEKQGLDEEQLWHLRKRSKF